MIIGQAVPRQALASMQASWQHHTFERGCCFLLVQRGCVTFRRLCTRFMDRAVFMQQGQPDKLLDVGFRLLQMADLEACGILLGGVLGAIQTQWPLTPAALQAMR